MIKPADKQVKYAKSIILEQDALYHSRMAPKYDQIASSQGGLAPFTVSDSHARLGTLEEDLGMEGTDYNLAMSILFVGYLLMQLPSNLLLTRVRPSLFLGTPMAIWYELILMRPASFMGCDFRLPGSHVVIFWAHCNTILSWICRSTLFPRCCYANLSHRIAWFYSGSSLANAFGGLIGAGVLGNLDGALGIAGWRWFFIIEGVITVGTSILAGVFLPNYPTSTSWLDDQEPAYAQ
ncbi:Major facilitator superfamily domain general substrate transporter [Penicillium coprophilum]|uniref:Major facilitator superfamily domain general substrate transporter n=1 Tax=Penicillium coprophilum TaxID=36646 RepID=UPI0023A0D0B7|nr:Major facilitator superfamily domain general substrate transporter [Penicillium coprophilum]KAJ5155133.1 Major facilitator superfamily domain general substrate transporter [Penicillium coprophilum]